MNNRYVTEIGYLSYNHVGEELCGDHIEVTSPDEKTKILVLADGLGSGVKANILSTLTAKMLSSLIAGNITIEECIRCIAKTLPVCKEREVAYSTFSIIKVEDNAHVDIYNFDNPEPFLIRDGEIVDLPFISAFVEGKTIYHARIEARPYDAFFLMSDGVKYAGAEEKLNYDWDMPQIKDFVKTIYRKSYSAMALATELASQCNGLYAYRPTDDTTVAVVRIRERKQVSLMFGPPSKKEDDERMMSLFFAKEGFHIVSGGTTGNIVANYLHQKLVMDSDQLDKDVPPIAFIEGVDLVTEGFLTMRKVLALAKDRLEQHNEFFNWYFGQDGASLIAQYLFETATDVHFFVGCASNDAHQEEGTDMSFSTKMHLIDELAEALKKMGKNVRIIYF